MKLKLSKKLVTVIVLALTLSLSLTAVFFGVKNSGNGIEAQSGAVTSVTTLAGTAGNNGENYDKLFDGNKHTGKWGVPLDNLSEGENIYVIFKTQFPVVLDGYTFTTANDNEANTGRNPKSWVIYGSSDYATAETPTWVAIHTVTDDETMEDKNFTPYSFTVSGNTTRYQYYKLEISATAGAGFMQLCEMELDYHGGVKLTALEGTSGHSASEGYENLFDGASSGNAYKWSPSLNPTAYVIFEASEPIKVKGYTLTTASDNSTWTGCNPKTWTLYGSSDYDTAETPTWSAIHTVTDDQTMQDVNYTPYTFLTGGNTTYYKYYKFEATENHGGYGLQLCELSLDFDICPEHVWGEVSQTAATCSYPLYKNYVCGTCGHKKSEQSGLALGHVLNDEFYCSRCEKTLVYQVGPFTVKGGDNGIDFSYTSNDRGGELVILTSAPVVVANTDFETATKDIIFVRSGVDAVITLAGVNIDASPRDYTCRKSALIIEDGDGDVTVTLEKDTVNKLKGSDYNAGLQKNGEEGTLTIGGEGRLDATGGDYGVGIGSVGSGSITRNITITSGVINAVGNNSAGIGGSYNIGSPQGGSCDNIKITGGTVSAISQGQEHGIGAGDNGATCRNIIIIGGSVKVRKATAEGGVESIGSGRAVHRRVAPVTPAGESLYAVTIANPDGLDVYIDGAKYPYKDHTALDAADTNLYVYLTGAAHTVTVGDVTTTYHFKRAIGGAGDYSKLLVCAASENYVIEGDTHYFACVNEGCTLKYGQTAHVYDKLVKSADHLKTDGTCTSAAVYYKSCVCGKNGTDTFDGDAAPGHDFSVETVAADRLKSDATCTSPAIYYKSCSVCGEKSASDDYVFENGDTLPHDFSATVKEGYLKTPATCTERAVYYKSCSECGQSSESDSYTFLGDPVSGHDYEWKYDGTQHWKKCSVCLEETTKNDHGFSVDCQVTCNAECGYERDIPTGEHEFPGASSGKDTHTRVCSRCSYKLVEAHDFAWAYSHGVDENSVHAKRCRVCARYDSSTEQTCSGGWTYDSGEHYRQCSTCTHKYLQAAHSFDNACDETCNFENCEYTRSVTHDYKTTYDKDDTHHWKACKTTGCTSVSEKAEHSCTLNYTSTTHWYECDCGYIRDQVEHSYDNDDDLTCNVCPYVRPKTLDKISFNLSGYSLDAEACKVGVSLAQGYEGVDLTGLEYGEGWIIITDIDEYLEGSGNSPYTFVIYDERAYLAASKQYYLALTLDLQSGYKFDSTAAISLVVNGKEIVPQEIRALSSYIDCVFALPVLTGESSVSKASGIEFDLIGHTVGASASQMSLDYTESVAAKIDLVACGVFKGDTLVEEDNVVFDTTSRFTMYLMLYAAEGYTFYGVTASDITVNGAVALGEPFISAGGGVFEIEYKLNSLMGEHTHVNGEYLCDDEKHLLECALCYANLSEGVHEYDDILDETCNVCGYVRELVLSEISLSISGYSLNSPINGFTISPVGAIVGAIPVETAANWFTYGEGYDITLNAFDAVVVDNDSVIAADEVTYFMPNTQYYAILNLPINRDFTVDDLTAADIKLNGEGIVDFVYVMRFNSSGTRILISIELPVLKGESTINCVNELSLNLSGYEVGSTGADISLTAGSAVGSLEFRMYNRGSTVTSNTVISADGGYSMDFALRAAQGYSFVGLTAENLILPAGSELIDFKINPGGGYIYGWAYLPSLAGEHEHSFDIQRSNQTSHWKECSVCYAHSTETSHVYDDENDFVCDICSYERKIVLTSLTLSLSGYEIGKPVGGVTITSTDTSIVFGEMDYGDDLYVATSSAAAISIFLDCAYIINNAQNVFRPAIEYFVLATLDFGSDKYDLRGLTFENVTLNGNGKVYGVVERDQATLMVALKLKKLFPAHEHVGEWETVTASTCTACGEQELVCTICGETITRSVEKLPHSFGEWIRDKQPTTTENGHEYRECPCGEREERSVDKLPDSGVKPSEPASGCGASCAKTSANDLALALVGVGFAFMRRKRTK